MSNSPYDHPDVKHFSSEDQRMTSEQATKELHEGMKTLEPLGPCVTIFGSGGTEKDSHYYNLSKDIAYQIGKAGYGILSGGGGGAMEAANVGAQMAQTHSVGLKVNLPFPQPANDYIDEGKLLYFEYIHIRKMMFIKYSKSIIVMPGGVGTLDELFEIYVLVMTMKKERFPVFLVGTDFWKGLLAWMEEQLLKEHNYINPIDLTLVKMVDSAEEVVEEIERYYACS
ncbi:TIGR00730 family Rossman fold protein [Algivirga pacifica]|uniref:Cytokinin riboside 5'-monophosphate phosphoribohydrolase n=1 Tax=Algivirga pacifica TaxID=1162670 RepID=A0ABP9D9T0_9BACT